jgi:hypothetical protein
MEGGEGVEVKVLAGGDAVDWGRGCGTGSWEELGGYSILCGGGRAACGFVAGSTLALRTVAAAAAAAANAGSGTEAWAGCRGMKVWLCGCGTGRACWVGAGAGAKGLATGMLAEEGVEAGAGVAA